jgi:hypothetical protein
LFFKLGGEQFTNPVEDAIRADQYEYPIAFPLRIRRMIEQREAIVQEHEFKEEAESGAYGRRASHEDYEHESVMASLALKRDARVIQRKKMEEEWKALNDGAVTVPPPQAAGTGRRTARLREQGEEGEEEGSESKEDSGQQQQLGKYTQGVVMVIEPNPWEEQHTL